MTNVGVNVVEVDGPTSPSIRPAATSIAAFVGRTERGIPNRPVRVTNMEQFLARFGGARSTDLLRYSVDGFFLNGGREAYIVRIAAAAAAPATANLNDRQAVAAATLRVTAGYRGARDPGGWASGCWSTSVTIREQRPHSRLISGRARRAPC